MRTNFIGYYPAVALDANNVAHIVYEGKDSKTKYGIFYTQLATDGTFSAPVKVSGKLPYAEVPDIAVRRGVIVVTFQSYDKSTGIYSICIAKSTDNGKTWK